jgi:hypothetical protein
MTVRSQLPDLIFLFSVVMDLRVTATTQSYPKKFLYIITFSENPVPILHLNLTKVMGFLDIIHRPDFFKHTSF